MTGKFIEIGPNIKKYITEQGKLGPRPSLNWTCDIEVKVKNGASLFKSGSLQIVIGDGENIYERLVERCVENMLLGEESVFFLKVENESLVHTIAITLKSYIQKPYIFKWTDDEKIQVSNYYRDKGRRLFNENRVEEAFYKFSQALKLLIMLDSLLESDEPCSEVDNMRIILYNNLARCHLHFENYSNVIELCTKSVNIKPTTKALYRRSLAYINLKEYERAENDLIALLKIEPKNVVALEKYKIVRELDRTNRENYQSILRKMFK